MSETAIILVPAGAKPEMTMRYRGLEQALGENGLIAAFAYGHNSYNPTQHSFSGVTESTQQPLDNPVSDDIAVVRDLTMPADLNRPLYNDTNHPHLVHHPEFNEFLKDKRNLLNLLPEYHPQSLAVPAREVQEAAAAICGSLVVVKPVSGMRGAGVYVSKKENIETPGDSGNYLVQEFIDTQKGVPELDIHKTHNVRIISIDSKLIGAVGRIDDGRILSANDIYGKVYLPEELPETMTFIAEKIQAQLRTLPGEGHNVIAIDLMRGINSQNEEVDVICEVNRRPLRISEYDTISKTQLDEKGLRWLAEQWDQAEAHMLSLFSRSTR